jgi:hypothetical protein
VIPVKFLLTGFCAYDSRPELDEQVHRRLPFFAVLLREYGRSIEDALKMLGSHR